MAAGEEGSFRGTRARRIVWQSWSPAGDQQLKGVVTIAHGYGEHIGRYEHVAQRLNEAGFAVYGLDHQGHGRSGGKRGRIELREAVADLDQLIVTVSKGRHPELPQFLLGHSLGGAIALRYAMAHQDRLTGLGAVGATRGRRGRPGTARVRRGRWARCCREGAGLEGGAAAGEPRPGRRQGLHRRPAQLSRRRSRPGVARDMIVHVGTLAADVKRITLPTLLMWGTADRLCPPAGSELVAANIGSEDLTVRRYEGLFHEIMNEPEQEQVLDDLVGWLGAHLPASVA